MATFVVDANVVVQIAISGGDMGPLARHSLIAPPLVRSESLSAIAEMTFRGEIPAVDAHRAMLRIGDLAIEIQRPADIDERAWAIARALGWSKTYDAEYVALAQVRDVPLITLDARLRRGAAHLVSMPRAIDLG